MSLTDCSLDYHPAMVLEDLHDLVETVQGRIDAHFAELQKSEALTRYALIDPLLRELGWDTADPNQVRVELPLAKGYAQQGFADYALLGTDGKPRVVVEAKSLGSSLQQAAMQALGYCNALGFPYFAVTDGRFWELYETFRPLPLPEKLVMKLDLKGPIARTCLDSLALWRAATVSGTIGTGADPVIDDQAQVIEQPPSLPTGAPSSDSGDWHELSKFAPTSGTKPLALRLPDNVEITTRGWGDFIAEIGRWLHENGHLKPALLPIQRSVNSYVVAEAPVNPNGKGFSAYRKIGPFYANVNLTSVAIVRNARTMIERTGQNSSQFAVKLQ